MNEEKRKPFRSLIICFPKIDEKRIVGEQFFNPNTGRWELHGTGHSVGVPGGTFYPVIPNKRKLIELKKAIEFYLDYIENHPDPFLELKLHEQKTEVDI